MRGGRGGGSGDATEKERREKELEEFVTGCYMSAAGTGDGSSGFCASVTAKVSGFIPSIR